MQLHYPHKSTASIAKALGRTAPSLYNQARRMGLEKTLAYKQTPEFAGFLRDPTIGMATRWQKGRRPR